MPLSDLSSRSKSSNAYHELFVWKRYLELKENVKNDRPRSHDCEALGPKLQNFHDPIVSHFPEEA